MTSNRTNRSHPTLPTNQQWTDHIHSLIKIPLDPVPIDATHPQQIEYIESFKDEFANRRNTDQPFLNNLFQIQHDLPANLDSRPLDEQLWWIAQSDSPNAQHALDLIAPEDGFLPDQTLAIEYRTKVELCALHASWTIASITQSESLKARCMSAAFWHTQELQPDNAINRPWGVQVFIHLSQITHNEETRALAHLHAQTLIHNTSITLGHPDILSALILKDALKHL